MKRILEKAGETIMEAVFPSNIYCIRCGSLIDRTRDYALCDDCIRKMHWITGRACEKCGKALPDTYRGGRCYDCMRQEHVFIKGFSCLTYGLYEREILMEVKHNGRGYMAVKLGDVLYDRMMCEEFRPDVVIPVPTGRKRERSRGYNQAALMAKQLGKRWNVPSDVQSLQRVKETAPLHGLNPGERQAALENVFAVKEKHRKYVRGKVILLVDDIYTTGATADACSTALLEAGAQEVYLLTLASGGNWKPKAEQG